MADPIILGSEVKQPAGQDNAVMIGLTHASQAVATLSMFNMSTGAIYQVPAGKKLCLIEMSLMGGVHNTANIFTLYAGPTVDSTVGATQLFNTIIRTSSGTNEPTYHAKFYAEVPASNYVTAIQMQNGTAVLIGIELDA